MATNTVTISKGVWTAVATGPVNVSFSPTHDCYFLATGGGSPGKDAVGYFASAHNTQYVEVPTGEILMVRSTNDAFAISIDQVAA